MSTSAAPPLGSGGEPTIFALSSARGRAGVAVIRVSGGNAGRAVEALTGRPPAPPRQASLRAIRDPASAEILDHGLILWFPAPASATGEDVAEFHVHGGPAVQEGVLAALSGVEGLAPAAPGAFTRRAFDNGKLDLTEVEGLADLIEAETAAQRRQALRQFEGGLGDLYEGWRSWLVGILAHVEAAIDFSDEDLPEDLVDAVRPEIGALASEVRAHLADDRRGEILRDGLSVAIVGAPNAGKSSILNALARREVAIVSATAGTTRDVIEVRLDLDGYPVVIADTAGLREVGGEDLLDPVEVEGMRRARARAREADYRLVVVDGTQDSGDAPVSLIGADTLVLLNKCDLPGFAVPRKLEGFECVSTSAVGGEGLPEVLAKLSEIAAARMGVSEAPALTRLRHRAAVAFAADALDRACGQASAELIAEDLRLAARHLGELVGKVDVEQLLDVIFRDFCIGK